MTALSLHGVIAVDDRAGAMLPPNDTRLVVFRDLAAIVSDRPVYSREEPDQAAIDAHRTVVDATFRRGEMLPAPAGVVFRTEAVLLRWMELHYVALHEALLFVHERVAARVHVGPADLALDDTALLADLTEAAAGALRDLRRLAVASVPVGLDERTRELSAAAFLVAREQWDEFERAVGSAASDGRLGVRLTGPWPPYDFVRLQFDH